MSEKSTHMVHYACDVCEMTATCVATPSAVLAWLDHMDTHSAKQAYRAWGWDILELAYGVSPDQGLTTPSPRT